jgi:hypothetical protein
VSEHPALELAELAGQPRQLAQPVLRDELVERFLASGGEAEARSACSPRADSLSGWCLARLAAVIAPASWRETHSSAKVRKLEPRPPR